MKHKRGKGTEKQAVLVAVERYGSVRWGLVDNGKAAGPNQINCNILIIVKNFTNVCDFCLMLKILTGTLDKMIIVVA